MNLALHLSIHFLFSLLAGLLVWLSFKKSKNYLPTGQAGKPKTRNYAFIGALIGGFLIDFDHFIDYFLAFGFNFKLDYFVHGYEFLKSDKIYILFHGWEYVILLVILGFLLVKYKKTRLFIFAMALGAFFHLNTDIVLNEGMKPESYLIFLRAKNNFEIEKTVTPEHYQKHLKKKYILESL